MYVWQKSIGSTVINVSSYIGLTLFTLRTGPIPVRTGIGPVRSGLSPVRSPS